MAISADDISKLRPLWSTWPPELQSLWEQWLLTGHGSANPSLIPPDSLASAATYARHITYAFDWLARRGRTPHPSVWTRALLEALKNDLIADAYAPLTIRNWLIGIDRLIVAVHPDQDRDALRLVLKTIPRQSPAGRKAGRIPDANELVELGVSLMEEALSEPIRDVAAAILFRIGLMIALLALRPYRRSVFWSFDYVPDADAARRHSSTHLTKEFGKFWLVCRKRRVRPSKVFGEVRRRFGTARNKGGGKFAPERLDVPSEIAPYMEKFLSIFRPILLANAVDDGALWLSQNGTRLSSIQIYKDISTATRNELGRSCAPQLFRDAYASTIQQRDPTMALEAHRALGHTARMTHDRYIAPNPAVTIAVGHRVGDIMGD